MPDSTAEPEPLCEFTNPCTTTTTTTSDSPSTNTTKKPSSNPRKVISHIFGRNKTSTKLFPSSVWVHHCRKHYQRARYRSTQWPFTQCELLLDSLDRMERWGGVKCFELVLRRREVERVGFGGGVGGGEGGGGRVGNGDEGGRWLRSRAGKEVKEREDDEDSEESFSTGSGSISTQTSVSASASSNAIANANDEDEDEDYSSSTSSNPNPKSQNKTGKSKQRKKPLIEPAPVPNWLRQETGKNKSFHDIRDIIRRLSDYLTRLREEGRREEIRFPDIEILPKFQGWVLKSADGGSEAGENATGRDDGGLRSQSGGSGRGQARKSGRKVTRVSGRGAVQKVQG